MKKLYDVIIVGGGAAGFFAGNQLLDLHPDIDICLLEKSNKVLSKVLVSGGGRCNVCNAISEPKELIKCYPRGGKNLLSVFYKFGQPETLNWFLSKGVEIHAEQDGRMFPVSNSSQTIARCLYDNFTKNGAPVFLQSGVKKIEKNENIFQVELENGQVMHAKNLILAVGGISKKSQADFLSAFQHNIIDPVPSLFTFNMPGEELTSLMGLSVPDAEIKILQSTFTQKGPLLITHWGLSGPAILKLSAFAARFIAEKNYTFDIEINWTGKHNSESLVDYWAQSPELKSDKKLKNLKYPLLPNRLFLYFLNKANLDPELNLSDFSIKQRRSFAQVLCKDLYTIKGKTTFKEEFVSAGGIDLSEIDMRRCESKKVKGLFFCGEMLDIDGITGGFNFQAAWSTAYAAAESIALEMNL